MAESQKITYTTLETDERFHGDYEKALLRIEQEFGQHHPIFIGERSFYAAEEFPVHSPIDRRITLGYFQKGKEEEARAAIDEAKRWRPDWAGRGFEERVQMIRKTAAIIEDRMFLLAALVTYEVGKNRAESLAEIGEAVDLLRYYCDIYEKNSGYRTPMAQASQRERSVSAMKPHGVWAVIAPFNFPFALAAGMCTGALLTGNTVVFKPTSEAPYTGLMLYHAFVDSGIPPGVINLVTGPGGPFGNAVASNPDVDGISFTGSKKVGMWLYQTSATRQPYPKPLVLELGSKNPAIVTATADLDRAVEGVSRAAFGYGGQKCSATSRVYVQSAIAEEFLERIRTYTEGLPVGDPRKKETYIGPIINESARKKYEDAVEEARRDGGTIITGGKVLEGGEYSFGQYLQPTIVTGLSRDHRLLKEELFVPFLAVDTFDTIEEALDKANDTDFGLTAGIFSEDPHDIDLFFSQIQFGVCYANRRGGATTGAWPGSQPFGGWRASGSTGRGVGGPYYLLSYMREQAQTIVE
jgi:1-pyrroline-5-carboxylate dehydrogenase